MSELQFQFLHFQFNSQTLCLTNTLNQQVIQLEPKVASLLSYFLQHPQQVISKDQLFNSVWKDTVVTDHSISWSLSQLRKALGDQALKPTFIKTISKRGYQFLPQVTQVEVTTEKEKKPPFRFRLVNIATWFPAVLLALITVLLLNQDSEQAKYAIANIESVTNLDGLEEDPQLSPEKTTLLFRHKSNQTNGRFQLYMQSWPKAGKATALTNDNFIYQYAIWGDSNTIYAVRSLKQQVSYACEVVALTIQDNLVKTETKLHDCDGYSASKLAYNQSTGQLFFTDRINSHQYALFEYNLTSNDIKQLTFPQHSGLGDHFISFHHGHQQLLILRDQQNTTDFLVYQPESQQLRNILTMDASYRRAHLGTNKNDIWLNWGNERLVSYNWVNNSSVNIMQNSFGWNYNLRPINAKSALFTVTSGNDGDILDIYQNEQQQLNSQTSETLVKVQPQGNYIAFVSNKSGLPKVYLRELINNSERELFAPNNYTEFRQLAWSPDGRYLLSVTKNTIHVSDMQTNSSYVVAELSITPHYLNFSADGKQLLFTSNDSGQWQSYQLPFVQHQQPSEFLDNNVWLVKHHPTLGYLYSVVNKPGLFKYNGQHSTLVADWPANDYWVIKGDNILLRQTFPTKQLKQFNLTTQKWTTLQTLPENSLEAFSATDDLQRFVFQLKPNKQSDIKRVTTR